ncbi:uncharacterized protein A4U43_C01F20130 [Asparagus officinalis]|uniref:Uncharacterized protein n=1 Tax=Asparagus officinalis TaxID=4686 RepID=A0A5P1FRK3_ASPOF|nr:uncharacterized protein A4U43_C01F20130 [Asparagus officinalis]
MLLSKPHYFHFGLLLPPHILLYYQYQMPPPEFPSSPALRLHRGTARGRGGEASPKSSSTCIAIGILSPPSAAQLSSASALRPEIAATPPTPKSQSPSSVPVLQIQFGDPSGQDLGGSDPEDAESQDRLHYSYVRIIMEVLGKFRTPYKKVPGTRDPFDP